MPNLFDASPKAGARELHRVNGSPISTPDSAQNPQNLTGNSPQISPWAYCRFLVQHGCDFFVGVPDSLLKSFCACAQSVLAEEGLGENFWIAANEGAAVGMAIGWQLAHNRNRSAVPLVYLQNSGLGNTLNPLSSMADPLVYSIPMLLLIGWRGELGQGAQEEGEQLADEPQHRHQGRITLPQLVASGIPYRILPMEETTAQKVSLELLQQAQAEQRPVALVVRKNTFASSSSDKKEPDAQPDAQLRREPKRMKREEAIGLVLDRLQEGPIVSTTGMISRELFAQRELRDESHERDFLVVGAMGHALSIAQGLALKLKTQNAQNPVYCLDGDGALLMHMGSLAVVGAGSGNLRQGLLGRFKHILLNNGAHDSVGGQPTVALQMNITALAKACGYRWAATCHSRAELGELLEQLNRAEGPALLEIRVQKGARKDLGRPTLSSAEIKTGYLAYLERLRKNARN